MVRNQNRLIRSAREYRGRNSQRSWAQFLSGLRMLFEAASTAWLLPSGGSLGPVLRRRDGFFHRSSLAGPDSRPARDAARGSPRGGVPVRHRDRSWRRRFWLTRDYLPEVAAFGAGRPSLTEQARAIGARMEPVLIPWDCATASSRPTGPRRGNLDEHVRRGIWVSTSVEPDTKQRAVRSLGDDLASGRWAERNPDRGDIEAAELGARLLIARTRRSWVPLRCPKPPGVQVPGRHRSTISFKPSRNLKVGLALSRATLILLACFCGLR